MGRIRPYDRDKLMKRLFPEIRAGRKRIEGETLFIVATQTIEVGADIDFDGLISEAAPLDSLRQRFGRLDRLGELGQSQGAIIYRDSQSKAERQPKPDPIYGMAIHDAWDWLQTVGIEDEVDFGILAMEKTMQFKSPPPPQTTYAPVLLPSHVRLFSQTGPDAPVIDVSPWLHGVRDTSPDVSIIWRSDLLANKLEMGEAVKLCPPLTREALEIPVYAVQSWLQGKQSQDLTDLEGVVSSPVTGSESDKYVLRWKGQDDITIIGPGEIRPGDTIVLPSLYGGCDDFGWNPSSQSSVRDIADFCSLERGGKHFVRMVPGLIDWLGDMEGVVEEAVSELLAAENDIDPEVGVDQDRVRESHTRLREILNSVDHPLVRAFGGRYEIELHSTGAVLRGAVLDDINGTINGVVAVPLDEHLSGVAARVRAIAGNHTELDKLILSAQMHDLGKKEPRFQIMMHGNSFSAAAGPLLAKSGMKRLSQKISAYKESGLPRGFRHELASLAFSDENDPLVCYLVGTHHGYGRPWFPECSDPQAPGSERALPNKGWLELFSSLCRKYGVWKIAGIELILRASDARQSMTEQGNKNA